MDIQKQSEIDLTVRSFAYMAKQLAGSQVALAPAEQYERIAREAENHRSALRLVYRDVLEMVGQALRWRKLTKAESRQLCEATAQMVEKGQQEITSIAGKYAPQRMAA